MKKFTPLLILVLFLLVGCNKKASKSTTNRAKTTKTIPSYSEPTMDANGNIISNNKPPTSELENEVSKNTFNITFGSCNQDNKPQPLWDPILANNPDLWIWTGDIIYADTKNMNLMRSKYTAQKERPDYKKLMNKCEVIGTWDDHDYGVNDGGKSYAMKKESKEELLSFLDVPNNATVRKRDGVYQSYTYGEKDNTIKIILLDCRTFKDDIERVNKISIADPNAELLGTKQWAWLDNELKNSTARINIIVSSIQVIPEEHRFEKWANHPTDRNRLFDLINIFKPKNTVIISGDRHIGEISKIELEDYGPVVEITSSGLTHAYTKFTSENNQHRVGKVCPVLNFGVIKVDWNTQNPILSIELRGENNKQLEQFQMTIN